MAQYLPRVTALNSNSLAVEERPIHDEFDEDGPGYLSVHGPRHDNDHLNFQDVQILPTTDEILAVRRPPYMPKKDLREANHLEPGPQRLLDTLFRHLRFDSVEGIRDVSYHAAQHLLKQTLETANDYEPQQETKSGNRYFLYVDVKFEELLSDEKRGVILRLSYLCPRFMRGRGMIKSGRLEQGMLCALVCLEEDGRSLSVTFFEVHMTQSTDSMKARNGKGVRAAVQLAFTTPAISDNVRRALRYAQGLSSGQYVLVEFPKLLYAGFYYCLHTLQQIRSTDIAFTKYIAPRNASFAAANPVNVGLLPAMEVVPPAYCTTAEFRFNLGCLAQNNASFSLAELRDAPMEFIAFLKRETTLDDGQAVALRDCLTREVAFTQGPPGTGKTFLGVALSRVLLASRSTTKPKPLLVVCLTNHALDSFLGGLLAAGVTKIARIGRGSKEEWIKKFELRALSRNTRLAQDVWDMKGVAIRNAQNLYTRLEAGCKGLNAAYATGSLSWPTVEAYLRSTHHGIYEQLTTSNDNPYARSFAFDYWAGGGDLRNLRELRTELETCLLGSTASEGSSISTEGIDRALEQITLHAQYQSARAEKNNIWRLSLEERQQMLRRWKAAIDREELIAQFATLHMEHQSAEQAVRNSWQKRDAKCLLEQDVIGLTTTACASNWEMLKALNLEIVICEEAGEVMEAHTLCSLFPSVQHAIFIGDPQQLRPEVNEQKMSLETATGSQYRLDESLFERSMIPTDPSSSPMPTSQLNIQRRMHPDIADLTRLVYPYLKDHPNTTMHPSTNGIAERMFWVDHRMPEADLSAASKSYTNPYEVSMVTGMVQYLLRLNAYSLGDIAIITPYNGQLAALHDSLKMTCSVWLSEKDRKGLLDEGLLPESGDDAPRSKDELSMGDLLRIATVDNFQGEEAKVVILSTVRSGERPGFLKTTNRINVACSRARDGFYIIGNSATLRQVPMWQQIIDIFAARALSRYLVAINASFGAVTKANHFHAARSVSSIFFVVIAVRVCVPIVGHQPPAPTNHAQIYVVPNFVFADITAIRNVTLVLHVLPAHNPVRRVVPMGTAKIYAVNLVTPVLSHTSSSAFIKHSRHCCAHYLLKSSRVASHAIEFSHVAMLAPASVVRYVPQKDLDRKLISDIYTVNEYGNITGFAAGCPKEPMDLRCVCGSHFYGLRRYSILKQMSQAPSVFARLLFKLGKALSTFSRRVHYHEKELGESFHPFRDQIRPNPLAANQNKAIVASRAQQLLRLSDSIEDFNPTAIAFEQSVRWIQTTLPTALLSITEHNICPVFSLRLTILQRRARNAWILDSLRVSSYLVGLEDSSLEVQRMGELLRIRASKECWKGIAECNTAVEKAITARTPAIEVELRLQQVQLSHLLDIALALARGSAQLDPLLPTMAPEPASESLQKAVQICRRFPDTAGRFGGLVSKFVKFASGQQYDKEETLQRCASQLASLPQSCTYETRKTELAWGECLAGSVAVCELGGHPYSSKMSGCPECGRIKEVEKVEEEARKAGECLFEDRFLQAMKGLAK